MKEKLNVVSLCWEYSKFPFWEVDRGFGYCGREVWSETVFAPTRGQARLAAYNSMDGMYPFIEINVRRKKSMDKVLLPEHQMIGEFTREQVNKMKHAIGFDSMQPFFRNHYVSSSPDEDWEFIKQKGLATSRPYNKEDIIYHLTDLGCGVIRTLIPQYRYAAEAIKQYQEKQEAKSDKQHLTT